MSNFKTYYMKKLIASKLCIALGIVLYFSGCIKDECKSTYKIYVPVYKTLTEVRASIKSEPARSPAKTGKVYKYGSYIFLNEVEKGIHVINNSNPSSPQNVGFINVPGNLDLAVKNGFLYADSYADMVVIDISDPVNAKKEKILNNVFPDRNRYITNGSTNPDQIQVAVDYIEKDTVVNCETYTNWRSCPMCSFMNSGGVAFTASAPASGQGGSTARFTIVNDYLYTVSHSTLSSFNVSAANNPVSVSEQGVGMNIETIYPFTDKLFIGSTTGMFIYSLASPGTPSKQGQFNHVTACDPVIADAQYAYVTLRTGSQCGGNSNQLDILNIANPSSPSLVKTYQLTNPYGLAKDGNLLFICDGKSGLKVYNSSDVNNLQLLKTVGTLQPDDVILSNNIALVVVKDGLYQFNYSNPSNITQLSKIAVKR